MSNQTCNGINTADVPLLATQRYSNNGPNNNPDITKTCNKRDINIKRILKSFVVIGGYKKQDPHISLIPSNGQYSF